MKGKLAKGEKMIFKSKKQKTPPRPGMITGQGPATPVANPAPANVAPSVPQVPQPELDYYPSYNNFKKTKNSKLIFLIILVILALIAVIGIVAVVLSQKQKISPIQNLEELQSAIIGEKAIDCELTILDNGDTHTIKANDKWRILYVRYPNGMNYLSIRDETVYVWSDTGRDDAAYYDYSSSMVGIDWVLDFYPEDIALKCFSPSDSNFEIPDKNWLDMRGA
jgi:hypothetical protein